MKALSKAMEEQAFVFEPPRQICLEDGGLAEGSERFDRAHIHAVEPEPIRNLQCAVGREVSVMGRGVGAHTGHHRAPVVPRRSSCGARKPDKWRGARAKEGSATIKPSLSC
jgi:hypothetical protein